MAQNYRKMSVRCEIWLVSDYFFKLANMNRLKEFLESNAFGVCAYLGEKMGIASSRIRLWFVYISFLTMGSPVIIYMTIAFWMNIKQYILAAKRNPLRYW